MHTWTVSVWYIYCLQHLLMSRERSLSRTDGGDGQANPKQTVTHDVHITCIPHTAYHVGVCAFPHVSICGFFYT